MTTYQTNCQCIKSDPEPNPAEFATYEEYAHMWQAWHYAWKLRTERHETFCQVRVR